MPKRSLKYNIIFTILLISLIFLSSCAKNITQEDVNQLILECEKIQDEFDKEECITDVAVKNKDPSICTNVQEPNDVCYAAVAKETQNFKICDKIKVNRGWVKDRCYIDIIKKKLDAQEKLDFSVCNKIETLDFKYSCYISFAVKKQDESICNNLPDKYKDTCITDVALKKQEISRCEKLQNQETKDECYYLFATSFRENVKSVEEQQNISICEKIKSQNWTNRCYYEIAETKNDPSICEKIQEDTRIFNRDGCYDAIATSIHNPKICDKIQKQWVKDGCYKITGIAQKDLSVCDKIQDPVEKKICVEVVTEAMPPDLTSTPPSELPPLPPSP